jgi:hypothetical protein
MHVKPTAHWPYAAHGLMVFGLLHCNDFLKKIFLSYDISGSHRGFYPEDGGSKCLQNAGKIHGITSQKTMF